MLLTKVHLGGKNNRNVLQVFDFLGNLEERSILRSTAVLASARDPRCLPGGAVLSEKKTGKKNKNEKKMRK